MKVKINETELRVKWTHLREQDSTFCRIVDENDKVILHGYSQCHPKDQFNKSTGRKVSLAKALEGMSKMNREQVWKEYLKVFPVK